MRHDNYPRQDILVESDWLEPRMKDYDLRIVDCDQYDSYRRAHIQNAVGISEHHYIKHPEYSKNPIGYPLVASPQHIRKLMESIGIGNHTTVVAYDGSAGLYAARFWWVLNYYGHTNAKVLNGGWKKWFDERRPITNDTPIPIGKPTSFTPREQYHMVCMLEDGIAAIGKPNTIFLDVRTNAEWLGTNDRGNLRVGHIPGAIHLEWVNFVTDDRHQTIKAPHELSDILKEHGITPDKNIITY
jgi:thiosulfate/3-mercaptopyruvate sulfurtransferase